MTATNHAITGAIIAVVVDKPLVALPLALLSHFIQDMIPHFGFAGHGGYKEGLKHRLLKILIVMDPLAFIGFLIVMISHHASIWIYLAAFLALSPDFHDFIAYFVFKKNIGWNKFSKFAALIQWCERPWGIAVEMVWYVGGLVILTHLLG
jgi:hypothetical protein